MAEYSTPRENPSLRGRVDAVGAWRRSTGTLVAQSAGMMECATPAAGPDTKPQDRIVA
jgi:hypothetical protein